MRIRRARHGDGALFVLQAIGRFIANVVMRWLLLHVGCEAAALDHEVGDDAVENGGGVVAFIRIALEVGAGLGSGFRIEFEYDRALVGCNGRFQVICRSFFVSKREV